MKLTFFRGGQGRHRHCHCLEVQGRKILIDCGLRQGKDERDNSVLDFAPNYIDYVIVTHAHIDHSGRIPLLIKEGFQGQIVTTRLTAQLMSVMLQDSAHIQEMDAQWKNQRASGPAGRRWSPLYTVEDAAQVAAHITTAEYGQIVDLCPGVKPRFVDAGHLLGSASVELWLEENGGGEKDCLLRGHWQHQPAHHSGPGPPGGGLCGHGEHLRGPEPQPRHLLHRRTGQDHRRHTFPRGAT